MQQYGVFLQPNYCVGLQQGIVGSSRQAAAQWQAAAACGRQPWRKIQNVFYAMVAAQA